MSAPKRAFDIVFSVCALIVAAPILLIAAVALRLDTPGPVFFRQTRLGRNGTTFQLLKLRGMYVDARERFPGWYAYPKEEYQQIDGYHFHVAADPRVTRVGRILRRYSVDELPNFWNVLRGEMSVVGPRPEIPELAPLYRSDLSKLLSVRPGVTSPAKATGRDYLTFEETLGFDLDYIDQRSFFLDLLTIARTAARSSRGHGVLS
ncbi:MAG TPA: sugar transferase [Galbitalea sp.]